MAFSVNLIETDLNSSDTQGDLIFAKVNDAVKQIANGQDLNTLMKSGYVFNVLGEQIGASDDAVHAAVTELQGNGLMILDEAADFRPRNIFLSQIEIGEELQLYASTPLNEKDLNGYVTILASDGLLPPEDTVDEPGVFNRMWDSISRAFGGADTKAMSEYRTYQAWRAEVSEKMHEGVKSLESAVSDAEAEKN